ncbi:UAA-domain-containing protein [Pholiota conissans]|uniref:UAA-domain-containing protein n=1 Tax=Pholiota conissans TaxID=109636 RepID=A0A9P5YWJ6_9AGAR|nr:UAA-domain-containing protein [Pholiota conissans]
MLSLISSWITTISLIFGGCCSNAITLEQLTLEHPKAGSVLTFFQFLVISLYGLPKFLIWTRFGPRFRPRRVPITSYLVQVALFYVISLLNNAAFAYNIPMAVHIIFRSGGLIISLVLGWLISKKKYSRTQIGSVLLVTTGVILTTLSAQISKKPISSSPPIDPYKYATGISILTLALVIGGFLGLIQDWTYTKYGRPTLTTQPASDAPASWQESMFYLHFLALPMFIPLLPDILAQLHVLNSTGSQAQFSVPIPVPSSVNLTAPFPMDIPPPFSLPHLPLHLFPLSKNASLMTITQTVSETTTAGLLNYPFLISFSIPQIYVPLLMNTITQLVCVAGVNRLTTRVSALTVTLVLVVRKAASLIISVIGVSEVGGALRGAVLRALDRLTQALLGVGRDLGVGVGTGVGADGWVAAAASNWRSFGIDAEYGLDLVGMAFVGTGTAKRPQEVNSRMMWTGAVLVLLGTVGYTIGSSRPRAGTAGVKSERKDKNKVE